MLHSIITQGNGEAQNLILVKVSHLLLELEFYISSLCSYGHIAIMKIILAHKWTHYERDECYISFRKFMSVLHLMIAILGCNLVLQVNHQRIQQKLEVLYIIVILTRWVISRFSFWRNALRVGPLYKFWNICLGSF